ncbi:hypothetical protein GALL_521730 [mine drainage metagenome]|uniref:Uncharacterized protein n=1 Tax=mine drainage metagenome TaxID=410659 RepID=A0A1J5PFE9_9ZZZZ
MRQALVADATLGRGHGTHERRVVVVVDPQPKPGTQVLDLGPVKKAGAARHLVRNLRLAQGFLERLGLVVGAVQHGKIAPCLELRPGLVQTTGTQTLDARHGALSLVFFGVGIHHPHRFTFTQITPQVFGKQLGVGANHMVGGTQDGAGRAVVLLKLDHFEPGKVDRQSFQVVQRGPAPAVNRLVIVTHGGKTGLLWPVASHQQLQQLVLRGVGILVLIDKNDGVLRDEQFPELRLVH